MLPGHFRMPFGELEGYSLARIVHFHPDYVASFLRDSALCARFMNIAEYFEEESPNDPEQAPVAASPVELGDVELVEPGVEKDPTSGSGLAPKGRKRKNV